MAKYFRASLWNQFLSQLPLRSQRALILAIPFVSLIMMIGGWLWSRQAEAEAQWWVSHTEEIIRESGKLHIELVDAETSIRGYGITENREFLQPYEQALTEIPIHLNKLKVFSNLISNAIKHHPRPDGKVDISVCDRDQDYQFIVADDGAGIEPKDRQKIFEIFQTLTARDQKENTGIGLSIVKKIVESQGGSIWLESEIGKGTAFHFNWLKSSLV